MFETPMENLAGWLDNFRVALNEKDKAYKELKKAEEVFDARRNEVYNTRKALIGSLQSCGAKGHEPGLGDYTYQQVSFSSWSKCSTPTLVYFESGKMEGGLFIVPSDKNGNFTVVLADLVTNFENEY